MVDCDSTSGYYDRYWANGVSGWMPVATLSGPMRSLLNRSCQERTVLDYGGGDDGRYGAFLRGVAKSVTVADISPSVLEARRRAGDEVIRSDRLNLLESTFDVLLMLEVLEHLLDPLTELRAASTHVRPGGTIVLSVPNAFSWLNRARMLLGRLPASGVGPPGVRGHTYDAAHIRFFDLASFRDLISRAGLEVTVTTTDYLETSRFVGLGQKRLWNINQHTAIMAGTLIAICRKP